MAAPAIPWRVRFAARLLAGGGIVAYPTEAVYGLGCDPGDTAALIRLRRLKGRDADKGFILIAADFHQLAPYIAPLPADMARRVRRTWPGPVTWVVPAGPAATPWLTGPRDTVAVRVTAHPVAAALCRAFGGAVVSTSANPQGLRPARDALTVRRYFGGAVDFILTGPVDRRRGPSEIRDARSDRVLRPAR